MADALAYGRCAIGFFIWRRSIMERSKNCITLRATWVLKASDQSSWPRPKSSHKNTWMNETMCELSCFLLITSVHVHATATCLHARCFNLQGMALATPLEADKHFWLTSLVSAIELISRSADLAEIFKRLCRTGNWSADLPSWKVSLKTTYSG